MRKKELERKLNDYKADYKKSLQAKVAISELNEVIIRNINKINDENVALSKKIEEVTYESKAWEKMYNDLSIEKAELEERQRRKDEIVQAIQLAQCNPNLLTSEFLKRLYKELEVIVLGSRVKRGSE